MFNRAPHPNAAKVISTVSSLKEGQTEFVRATGYISARLDVPTDHAPNSDSCRHLSYELILQAAYSLQNFPIFHICGE